MNNSVDDFSSGDESTSSSSSSTILATRTLENSCSSNITSHRRKSSTKTKAAILTMNLSGEQTNSFLPSSSRSTIQHTKPSDSTSEEPTNIIIQNLEQERQCWICYGDESDSEGHWVSPCPCSLIAHEKCLLDWIIENQKRSTRKLVRCPQCASYYHLVEKSNWLLLFFGVIDEVVHTITPYITSLGLGLSLLIVTTTYGASSVILLFGTQEGERVLGSPSLWTWRQWVGLPSIPLALLSTRFRLADSFLPFMTLLVLRLSSSSSASLPFIEFSWPPTPLATLGLLAWVRLAYNNIYYAAQGLMSRQLSLNMVQDQQRRRRRSSNNQLVLMEDDTVNQIRPDHTAAIPERSLELNILLGRGPPSIGMLFMSTLLWPVVSNLTGTCLSQVGWVCQHLPQPFHRNVFGGCLFVVLKDIGNLIYRYQRVRQYRSRRIQSFDEIKQNVQL
ncbi:hypothetical protein BCR42DRAFT_488445 [Absidia repens]|uniref:RING-CH-type domain-containing protein n=1 Tax=Absidia repens TaxID=90262 RepID=A0A1X2IS44_9FUNG|nr:hypothetical protein BCR42DRAFT_488445 [Absidia repens]